MATNNACCSVDYWYDPNYKWAKSQYGETGEPIGTVYIDSTRGHAIKVVTYASRWPENVSRRCKLSSTTLDYHSHRLSEVTGCLGVNEYRIRVSLCLKLIDVYTPVGYPCDNIPAGYSRFTRKEAKSNNCLKDIFQVCEKISRDIEQITELSANEARCSVDYWYDPECKWSTGDYDEGPWEYSGAVYMESQEGNCNNVVTYAPAYYEGRSMRRLLSHRVIVSTYSLGCECSKVVTYAPPELDYDLQKLSKFVSYLGIKDYHIRVSVGLGLIDVYTTAGSPGYNIPSGYTRFVFKEEKSNQIVNELFTMCVNVARATERMLAKREAVSLQALEDCWEIDTLPFVNV